MYTGDIDSSLIVGNAGAGYIGYPPGGQDPGLVRNSVIAGNSGGLYQSQKNVLNCTVTGNTGYGFPGHGGTIRHCIIWDNLLGALIGSTTPVFSGTANPYFVRPGVWDLVYNVWVDGEGA